MRVIYTDRSRVEAFQRCNRFRFLSYHENGIGLSPAKEPLPLAVGKAVHAGLASLLTDAMNVPGPWGSDIMHEDAAVTVALADFAPHRAALALDTTEAAAMAVPDPAALADQLARTALDLGMAPTDPSLVALHEQQRNAAAEFDQWLYQEQAALVEGLVRAYARRRLRPLLEEFEVLEVEREGEWELASWERKCRHVGTEEVHGGHVSLVFMSRPDALLRSRLDNSLYLLSFKTAAQWDVRKARDAEHDMQGLSEGVEVEKRLGKWWDLVKNDEDGSAAPEISTATYNYLHALPAPPRILGIRYEYLLKGGRYADKELSARFGLNVWSQRSHLIRRYVAHSTPQRGKNAGGYNIGDVCWSWDFLTDEGKPSKLTAQNWHSESILDKLTVKEWIDMLDTATMSMSAYDSTVGMEPREMGYKCDAQAQGFTAAHPLDEVFPPPLTVYRSDDQLRDWIDQVEAQERRVAEAVARVDAATDEGEKRHLLNVLFPQSRRACEYPSTCAFCAKEQDVCFGGEDMRRAPLESGKFKPREPHHAAEKTARQEAEHG